MQSFPVTELPHTYRKSWAEVALDTSERRALFYSSLQWLLDPEMAQRFIQDKEWWSSTFGKAEEESPDPVALRERQAIERARSLPSEPAEQGEILVTLLTAFVSQYPFRGRLVERNGQAKEEVQPPVRLENSNAIRDWIEIVSLDGRFASKGYGYPHTDHGLVQKVLLLLRSHQARGQELIDATVDAWDKRYNRETAPGFLELSKLGSLAWAAELRLRSSILKIAFEQCLLLLRSAKDLGDALEEWEADRLPGFFQVGLSVAIFTASAAFVMGVILPMIITPSWVVYAGIPVGIYIGSLILVVIFAIKIGIFQR